MPESTADTIRNRGDAIDSIVDAADSTNQERDSKAAQGIKGVLASDNPNKPGSALHRAGERKRQAGTLIAQKDE